MAGHLIKEGGLGEDGLSFFKTWCGIREVPTFFEEEELHEFLANHYMRAVSLCGGPTIGRKGAIKLMLVKLKPFQRASSSETALRS